MAQKQKAPELDLQPLDLQPVEDDAEELDLQPLDLQPVSQPEQPGLLKQGWDMISKPLIEAPSRWGRDLANYFDNPMERGAEFHPIKAFGAGALEGLGDLVSGLTSPINLATTALTGGSSIAAKAGLPAIARAAELGAKGAGALTAAHGGINLIHPDSTLADRAMGGIELAGGMLGMKGHAPTVSREMPADLAPPPVANVATEMAGAPKIGQRVTLRQATPEIIKKAKEQGWVFDSLTDDGKFKIRYEGKPGEQPLLESEVGTHRPTPGSLGPKADLKKSNPVLEAANFPRAVMASVDMSAPLRQGLPLIHKAGFWKAIPDMVRAWGSEEAFRGIQQSIADKPLFKPRIGPGGKELPSFAQDAGLKLTDLTDLTNREEVVMSTWAEKIPGVRRSNRAYTAFLNKLRADTFESLVRDGKVFGADGETNLPLARSLADFVNYSSGRGSLGKAERAAVILNSTFFAPRLIASRLKILNPYTYINPKTDSFTRKEAIKSLLALAGAGNAMVGIAKLGGAEVETNPASSDFGKIKLGNVRLDPWAGAQQYIVAANRMLRPREARIESLEGTDTGIAPIDLAAGFGSAQGGKFKSSTSGKEYFLGEKYGGSSRLDVAGRFLEGKANPIINFATGLMRGKDLAGQPFNIPDEVAKRFVPIFVQDVIELASENPELFGGIADIIGGNIHPENLPAAAPSFFGMGMQRYGNE